MSNDAVKLTKPIHKLEAVHIARSQSVQSPTRNDVAGSPPVQSPTTSSVRPQPGLRFSELWLLKSRHPAMVSCPVLAGSKPEKSLCGIDEIKLFSADLVLGKPEKSLCGIDKIKCQSGLSMQCSIHSSGCILAGVGCSGHGWRRGIAAYGFYCLNKHLRGDANVFEQLAIVTSAFTWLTLVPPAHFNGFLEGWPFVFFFVYHYFFFFNVSVRKRLYGDFFPREHDPKWDITLPNWQKLLFCAGVSVGHWIAAFEGPELHLIPGGWSNAGVWALIIVTLFMQYHSTLYLANYSEKVVVPTAVVQFGPYRFVRHPIYASTMLLFASYCIALRAPLSTLFTIAVCLMYYGQKAKLEEVVMVETFGERYLEYSRKVKYRFLPFVY
nr:uncharacterized protein LOC109184674 [Ipomoea trifida]